MNSVGQVGGDPKCFARESRIDSFAAKKFERVH